MADGSYDYCFNMGGFYFLMFYSYDDGARHIL